MDIDKSLLIKLSTKFDTDTISKSKPEVVKPSMYQVIMMNDDYTPMEFVVMALKSFFNKNHDEAVTTMLKIHYSGEAQCGIYTREVAETKVMQVIDFARKNKHPLKCIMRKDD